MYLLTELVRLLEQRGHVFPNDPHAATETLRHTQGDVQHKLHQRAQIIDRDQLLRQTLQTQQHRWQMVLRGALAIWFVLGFSSTYGLMKHTQLNFFLILLGVLGMNTLMLLFWLINTLWRKSQKPFLPPMLLRQNDSLKQTLAQLYSEQAQTPHGFWRRNAYGHQLALCALLGMFTAALFLMMVRQYSFNWESTLLNSSHFINSINVLAWLPEKIGFATPHAEAIVAGHNHHDITHAASWGSLLLGCMVCYGIVPRLLAWGWCAWQVRQHPITLNMAQPYYQNIIQKWQRKITDSDHDYQADPVVAPVVLAAPPSSNSQYWAVLLDAPHDNPNWYNHLLGQDWRDCGVIAEREEIAHFQQQLSQQPTQLLIGVRAHRAPDRGQIRTLGKLASHAQHGMVVKLLPPHDTAILAQWHEILHQNGWAWVA